MKTDLRKLTAAWPLLTLLLIPALTRAERAVPAWTNMYNGPRNSGDYAKAVVVDADNNVIVAGYATCTNNSPFSDTDYTTIKYSSAGVPLWTNFYNGPGNFSDKAVAAAADGSNNVIVTGYSDAATNFSSPINYDYVTIKYSSAGVPLWTNRFNGSRNTNDYPTAIVVDHSGDVIVTGYASFTNAPLAIPHAYEYATIKYSSTGMPLWTNRYNGGGVSSYGDQAYGVAVDGSNNVMVTGISDYYYQSFLTIAYSSAGVPLWTNRYKALDYLNAGACAVVVDGSNNVFVTGYAWSASRADYATIKYSSTGVPLWTNRYNGPGNYDDSARAIAVDRSGSVIVTGQSYGTANNYDYATVKYSNAGLPLWTNRYMVADNYTLNDYATAVAVDANGNVTVTGYSVGRPSGNDYTTIKYSSAGLPLWTNRFTGAGYNDDQPGGLALDGCGNVIVTGASQSSGSSYDFATVKYICVPEPVVSGVPGDGAFRLRVDDVLQPGTLVIEASTDLAGWSPVFTNTTPTNVLFYTEADAAYGPPRFYRAFQFP